MKNLVGDTALTAEQSAELLNHLSAAAEILAPCTTLLTSDERSRATKMRPDGEWVVTTLGRIATEHGLALPGLPVAAMLADLAVTAQLKPIAEKIAALNARLDDTMLEARSECWWAATAYYTALVRMSDSDPEIAKKLKPIVEYFSHGKRKKTDPQPK